MKYKAKTERRLAIIPEISREVYREDRDKTEMSMGGKSEKEST